MAVAVDEAIGYHPAHNATHDDATRLAALSLGVDREPKVGPSDVPIFESPPKLLTKLLVCKGRAALFPPPLLPAISQTCERRHDQRPMVRQPDPLGEESHKSVTREKEIGV
jgi:hypothetical protein